MGAKKQESAKQHSPKNPKNAGDKGLDSGTGSKKSAKAKGAQKVVPPKTAEEAFE